MDPEVALMAALRAIQDGDSDAAEDAMSAYAEWRNHGGFEPIFMVTTGDEHFATLVRKYEETFDTYLGARLAKEDS
jgi:hypothetical protein